MPQGSEMAVNSVGPRFATRNPEIPSGFLRCTSLPASHSGLGDLGGLLGAVRRRPATHWRMSREHGAFRVRGWIAIAPSPNGDPAGHGRALRGLGAGDEDGAMPARSAAVMPSRLSSKTRQSAGATPMRSAASRNRSGAGLPCATSSTVTTTGNRIGDADRL